VCDLSTVLAGPYARCSGRPRADVIKIEPPDGDARAWGRHAGAPEFSAVYEAGDPRARSGYRGSRPTSAQQAHLRLDLKPEGGRGAAPADRAQRRPVENYRVGGLRPGFSDGELERLNTRSAFHHRLRSRRPAGRPTGYDFIIEAVAELMSITGAPDGAGGEPTKIGTAISDLTTRHARGRGRRPRWRGRSGRSRLGRGQRIDLSLSSRPFVLPTGLELSRGQGCPGNWAST
jgi:crotonobetainyl-CoA:carnitine CoA-transferase CaiB-like acyl-CoA transferase